MHSWRRPGNRLTPKPGICACRFDAFVPSFVAGPVGCLGGIDDRFPRPSVDRARRSRDRRRGAGQALRRRRRPRRHRPARRPRHGASACSGPNGAGKTTAVRILTTILSHDAGTRPRARHRRRQGPAGASASASAWPASTPPSTRTSPAARTCAWSASSPTCPKATAAQRADELLERVRPDRRRRPPGPHLLRRHAPPARPRRRARAPAAGAVPRRADHRPRPGQPQRPVGGDRGAGGRRHHRAAHHPVPRGGRPAGRPHRRHRRRQDDRRGHLGRAQGHARRHHRRDRCWPTRPRPRPPRACWPRSAPSSSTTTGTRSRSTSATAPAGVLDVARILERPSSCPTSFTVREPTLDDVFLSLTGHRTDETEPDAPIRSRPPTSPEEGAA